MKLHKRICMKLHNRIKVVYEWAPVLWLLFLTFLAWWIFVTVALQEPKQTSEDCVVTHYEKITESRIHRGELRNIEVLEFTVTLDDGSTISSKTLNWDPEVEEVGALCSLSNKRNYEVTTLNSR